MNKKFFPILALILSLLACALPPGSSTPTETPISDASQKPTATKPSTASPTQPPLAPTRIPTITPTPYAVTDLAIQEERIITLKDVKDNPSFSPNGQWFAVYSQEHSTLCIFSAATLELASCAPRQGRISYQITWSANSQKVAFTEDNAIAKLEPDIWVYDRITQTLVNLTDDGIDGIIDGKESQITAYDRAPTWSPDGEWLVFVRRNLTDGSSALYRVSLNGGEPQQLVDTFMKDAIINSLLYWVGDKIYYHYNGVWEVSANGGKPRKIADKSEKGSTMLTDISTDGNRALISYPLLPEFATPVTCALLDLRSGEMEPITADPLPKGAAWIECGIFSPDDSKIVYAYPIDIRNASGMSYLAVRDVAEGTENLLYTTQDSIGNFPISNFAWMDNNTVYLPTLLPPHFILLTLTTDPTLVKPTVSATEPPVTNANGLTVTDVRSALLDFIAGIALSPNGQRLFAYNFVDNEMCILSTETLEIEICTPWESEKLGTVSVTWSPDNQKVAFTEDIYIRREESDIWIMDANTGELTNLTDDGVSAASKKEDQPYYLDMLPAWSDDSQTLLFARGVMTTTYSTTLYRVSISGGEPQMLADLFNDQFMSINLPFHRAGGALYYTVLSQTEGYTYNGVWAIDQSGQNLRWMIKDDVLIDVSPDGRLGIVFEVSPTYPKGSWLIVNFQQGEFQPIDEIMQASSQPGSTSSGAAFSPDGTQILYTYYDDAAGDYKLAVRDLDGQNNTILYSADKPLVAHFNLLDNLQWAENNLVLLFDSTSSPILLRLGTEK